MKKLRDIGSSISENPNDEIDPDYLVPVSELMKKELSRPKHKTRVLYNDGEFLPIVTVTVGLWEW